MSVNSTPASKLARPAPFTPKRPLSSLSTSSSDLSGRSTRSNTPLLSSTHKKYKAPVSAESRTRNYSKTKSTLAPVPGSPARSPNDNNGRPRTPGTPRKGSQTPDPSLMPSASEMDVSNVNPEEVLVDYQTVEPGDVSGEMDEAWLKTVKEDHGKQDKVMVSIRIRPSEAKSAWIPTLSTNSIQLDPAYSRNPGSTSASAPPTTFNFDSILTGSPNKPIYTTVARSHVHAAMEGFNAVIFAYGQTASGKTYTLTGDEAEPGIIPRAMRDVFGFIRRTPEREYLLRCSYLEIYNETIQDLLAPPGSPNVVQIQGGAGGMDMMLVPLREEVVTSLKGVKEVLRRGESHRRTACTDWNERSSRSHSVFRLVIESRERSSGGDSEAHSFSGGATPGPSASGRATPANGRQTPGVPPTPGGSRLQARDGRSVQASVLSLIDLAGSEKATSDKERTREGKYINTSLLTLGSVIGTLSDNAAKHKNDHVPYRNSKLTRMLQPSLSGNARISVICTINPDVNAVAETTSTLLFAKRVKGVKLNAQKKEIVDTDALIERYRKEIEDLKKRLAEKEALSEESESPRKRRLSAQEKADESVAMKNLNNRIQQLTKLILTSQTVDEASGSESRPASPVKVDFDMSPYQLQQELLNARLQLDTQATQILSLEAALLARPPLPADAPESKKDKLIAEQNKTIRELEIVVKGYEDNLGEPLRKVKEDVEKEWIEKLEAEKRKREEKERWADEVVKQLEKEKKCRMQLENERRALAAFVTKFDSLGLGSTLPSTPSMPAMPSPGGANAAFERRRSRRSSAFFSSSSTGSIASTIRPSSSFPSFQSPVKTVTESESDKTNVNSAMGGLDLQITGTTTAGEESPFRVPEWNAAGSKMHSLLEQMPEEEWGMEGNVADFSFEAAEVPPSLPFRAHDKDKVDAMKMKGAGKPSVAPLLGGKENLPF